MYKYLFPLFIASILFSCNNNEKAKNTNITNNTSSKNVFDVSYVETKSIYTLGDTVAVNIKTTDNVAKIDSISFVINGRSVAYLQNESTFFLITDSITHVGSQSIESIIYCGEKKENDHLQIMFLSDIAPTQKTFTVVNTFKHDLAAYTQGLEFHDNILYESTGLQGQSSLRKVNFKTGDILQAQVVDDKYFAEGITIFNNKIFQLTWQSNIAFVYDLESFQQIASFNYPTEGWGLTNNEKELIMSDGSNILYFLNPDTFSEIKRIYVCDNYYAINSLNELEYINGFIYANVYQKNYILKIDPETGKVLERINLDGILPKEDMHYKIDVLNGIAYNSSTDKLYVTGKNWPKLFEIKIIDAIN